METAPFRNVELFSTPQIACLAENGARNVGSPYPAIVVAPADPVVDVGLKVMLFPLAAHLHTPDAAGSESMRIKAPRANNENPAGVVEELK